MPPSLPSLSALRAFDAVARHGSVMLAARELCVTSSAVSHQLRALEKWLGVSLLDRRGPSLSLTEHGRAYLASVSLALREIESGTRALLHEPAPARLAPTRHMAAPHAKPMPTPRSARAAWGVTCPEVGAPWRKSPSRKPSRGSSD